MRPDRELNQEPVVSQIDIQPTELLLLDERSYFYNRPYIHKYFRVLNILDDFISFKNPFIEICEELYIFNVDNSEFVDVKGFIYKYGVTFLGL